MPRPKPTRDQKLENLIRNQGMITMGVYDEAFEEIAETLTQAIGTRLSEAADAVSKGPEGRGTVPPMAPRVRMEIGVVFTEIREEMESQWPKNPRVFKDYVSNPALDRGIEIVDSYDFHRPRLTEELTDEVLASYVFLLKGGDKEATKMFKELSDWQEMLPRPPWAHSL